ncbi:RNA dependent RNA polymerase-domain-containing protein [Crepidotus variabilis]|uniref:RNA-dependent RNA polymerase n=1 Tax=Crepidotus variabilis TaxID=179855 RepID=A0A9P6EVB0_9AGAR|nr:RNA dependent RNA polymerase-domain-containing protein [Crepidotus variabilis]
MTSNPEQYPHPYPQPKLEAVHKSSSSPSVTLRKNRAGQVAAGLPRLAAASESPTTKPLVTVPQSVRDFSETLFGTDLDTFIIAHCDETQRALDKSQIAWGVQFEFARGVSAGLWAWEDVRRNIDNLRGSNLDSASRVEKVMRQKNTSRPSDTSIWQQLDLEQEAIVENIGRGLGLMGDFGGVCDWSGGKVQQIGRLEKDGTGFRVKLERMESRRSHRFARYYGSRRFLQLRISDDLFRKEASEVKKFLRKKFVICGRVFVPFHSKEMKVYLVETNENHGRSTQTWCADDTRHSFNDFINWHNPLNVSKNCKQVISKYAARFALGLSNSRPVLEFQEEDIHFIEDKVAEGWKGPSKDAPADKLMTDGCGFINHAGLVKIVKALKYSSLPAGVQGRIDGSKGFFILHPTDKSDAPKIWIRDSQHKIQNRGFDRAHRIFDLLCASQSMPPTALTSQMIINLFSNGIPAEMLADLMEKGLENEVAQLLEWDKPHAMVFLYDAVSKCGGVSGSRAQRVVYSLNRVLGFTGRDWRDDDGATDEDGDSLKEDDDEASTMRNKYSKMPFILHEVALELIQAGFHPRENKLLQDKILYMVKSTIKASVEKFRIPLAESVGAFIVPDPLGVLEEGEVCFRFSKPRKNLNTEMLLYSLEGEILLGRYPIRLPSDMQRVKAVDKRELDKWPDVLIVSTKGKRSIASLLADGDMDGDEIVAIYDKMIVELFRNQQFTEPPSNFLKDNFNKDVESVEQFCSRVSRLSNRGAHEAFQEVLIANLSESQVGLYSMMHENATIRYGYDSRDAIRLAYIFATLLDSSKNGCRLQDGLFKKDLAKYGSSARHGSATPTSGILALLKDAGKRKGDELLTRYQHLEGADEWLATDAALLKPIQKAASVAQTRVQRKQYDYRAELDLIARRIEVVDDIYRETWKQYFAKNDKKAEMYTPSKGKSRRPKAEKQDDLMLECARKYAEPIEGLELIQNVEELKASYTYQKKPGLAFSVAFNELCRLKASAAPGGIAPSARVFDEARSTSSSYLRALAHTEETLQEPRA